MNNGRDYERFVGHLQQALLDSEKFMRQKNILIEANKKIIDSCNIEREFDLYWEYELAGVVYKTVIECKDYQSRVSVEKIDALVGKTRDFPDVKALFATKTGYQSGAKKKAEVNKIDLLIVREQSNVDWEDKDGNPYLNAISINGQLLLPVKTISFMPEIDGNWAKKNTDIDVNKPFSLNVRNDLTTIEDVEKGEKYSILQLEQQLTNSHLGKPGSFTKKVQFDDAYIYFGHLKLKLNAYEITYAVPPPIPVPIDIDLSKELIGIIEYLHQGTKTAVFKDRIVKDWK